jgi:hypothetical protein
MIGDFIKNHWSSLSSSGRVKRMMCFGTVALVSCLYAAFLQWDRAMQIDLLQSELSLASEARTTEIVHLQQQLAEMMSMNAKLRLPTTSPTPLPTPVSTDCEFWAQTGQFKHSVRN